MDKNVINLAEFIKERAEKRQSIDGNVNAFVNVEDALLAAGRERERDVARIQLELHLVDILLEDPLVQKYLALECKKELDLQMRGVDLFEKMDPDSDEYVYLVSVVQSAIAAKLLMSSLSHLF